MKCWISLLMGVCSLSVLMARPAICPMRVLSAVRHTTALQDPSGQLVPKKARFCSNGPQETSTRAHKTEQRWVGVIIFHSLKLMVGCMRRSFVLTLQLVISCVFHAELGPLCYLPAAIPLRRSWGFAHFFKNLGFG